MGCCGGIEGGRGLGGEGAGRGRAGARCRRGGRGSVREGKRRRGDGSRARGEKREEAEEAEAGARETPPSLEPRVRLQGPQRWASASCGARGRRSSGESPRAAALRPPAALTCSARLRALAARGPLLGRQVNTRRRRASPPRGGKLRARPPRRACGAAAPRARPARSRVRPGGPALPPTPPPPGGRPAARGSTDARSRCSPLAPPWKPCFRPPPSRTRPDSRHQVGNVYLREGPPGEGLEPHINATESKERSGETPFYVRPRVSGQGFCRVPYGVLCTLNLH